MEKKARKCEHAGTAIGLVGDAVLGAKVGAGIGLASGGWAIPATVPLGVLCGAIAGLAGNRIGVGLD